MKKLKAHLGSSLDVEVFNDGSRPESDVLNLNCGADFVKVDQCPPRGMEGIKGQRCVSVDGDAGRVIYFYNRAEDGAFALLDGDKIATLGKKFKNFKLSYIKCI